MGDEPGDGKWLVVTDFDPVLLHRLKVLAEVTGTTVKEIVTAGVRRELERRELAVARAGRADELDGGFPPSQPAGTLVYGEGEGTEHEP